MNGEGKMKESPEGNKRDDIMSPHERVSCVSIEGIYFFEAIRKDGKDKDLFER